MTMGAVALCRELGHKSIGATGERTQAEPMVTQAILGLPSISLAGLVGVLLLAGVVKGATGVGLPLVLVPLTTQILDVPVAVALLPVPMIASNIGQAMEGGRTIAAIRQLVPVLATLIVGTFIGVHLLVSIDRRTLSLILGVTFIGLAAMLAFLPRLRIGKAAARWAGPLVGFCAGVLGGMSAIFGPPMIAYFISLGLPPNLFIKQMAIVAFTASLTLAIALGGNGSMSPADFLISASCLIPIQLGMPLGRWLRARTKPEMFRVLVLLVLALGGLDMLRRAWF
jgi:uncharacterized protein